MRSLILFLFYLFFWQTTIAQPPTLVPPLGHTTNIDKAILSPDEKKIVTVSWDGTAKIWDARTGELLKDITAHKSKVTDVCFTNAGDFFALSSWDKTVTVWNATTGKRAAIINGFNNDVQGVEFSRDGRFLVSFSEKDILIYDRKKNEQKHFEGELDIQQNNYAISPDSKIMAVATFNNSIVLVDMITKVVIKELKGHTEKIKTISFNSGGDKMLSGSADNTAKVWDVASGNITYTFEGHAKEITSCAFSIDGKKIITSSWDNTGKLWDANNGKLLFTLAGHTDIVGATAFSNNSLQVATASNDNTIKIWDTNTGKLNATLSGHTDIITSVQFNSADKKIISSSWDNSAKVWNIESKKAIITLEGKSALVNSAYGTSAGTKTFVASTDYKVRAWNNKNGNLAAVFDGHSGAIVYMGLNKEEAKLVTASYDSSAIIWDVVTGKKIVRLNGHTDILYKAIFSPDGKVVATCSADETIKIWTIATGKLLYSWPTGTIVRDIVFDETGKQIAFAGDNSIAAKIDIATGKMTTKLAGHTEIIIKIKYSHDYKKIATASFDNSAKIWDAQTGTLLVTMKGHSDDLRDIEFSADNTQLLTRSDDKTIKLWNVETGALIKSFEEFKTIPSVSTFSKNNKHIITGAKNDKIAVFNIADGKKIDEIALAEGTLPFLVNGENNIVLALNQSSLEYYDVHNGYKSRSIAIDSSDYFTQIATGEYLCTQDAAKLLHYVTNNLKVISFEQLDVKYNRPDRVLKAIGNTDTALIKSYRKAWEKRIKKLGIDTTTFKEGYNVPDADFTNRNAIENEQKNETLTLVIKGVDSSYLLDRFNVWVNETPVFGQRGINIRNRNKNDFDTAITIKLTQGENRIEMSVANINGVHSYRMPLTVNYSPAVKQKETVRFIGIGIEKFADSKYNLQYSSKDIRDLAKKMKEKYKGDIIIDTLFNEKVTVANVKALKQKLQQTTVNDKVIVAYSGHGMLSKDYDYYLSTYSVNFENPEQMGLPYDELENLLDSIPARKKLMLIDACHSGEVDKEDLVTLTATPDSLIKGLKPVAYAKEGQLGLKNSFELMQSLFVNVGKSTGATIISAAAGTQFALERNDLKNGVFTYSILEAMNKYSSMKISELKKIVGERVEALTKGLQKPTSRNEMIAVDWRLW